MRVVRDRPALGIGPRELTVGVVEAALVDERADEGDDRALAAARPARLAARGERRARVGLCLAQASGAAVDYGAGRVGDRNVGGRAASLGDDNVGVQDGQVVVEAIERQQAEVQRRCRQRDRALLCDPLRLAKHA